MVVEVLAFVARDFFDDLFESFAAHFFRLVRFYIPRAFHGLLFGTFRFIFLSFGNAFFRSTCVNCSQFLINFLGFFVSKSCILRLFHEYFEGLRCTAVYFCLDPVQYGIDGWIQRFNEFVSFGWFEHHSGIDVGQYGITEVE